MLTDTEVAGATFSDCRTWRYALWRNWNPDDSIVSWVCLNPSTADETRNDPTIRRCIRFAKGWGFGGLVILNLFGARSPLPSAMKTEPDPIGPRNLEWIKHHCDRSALTVAAWGVHGTFLGQDKAVCNLLGTGGLQCLGVTKDGHPRHPLYVKADTELIPFSMGRDT